MHHGARCARAEPLGCRATLWLDKPGVVAPAQVSRAFASDTDISLPACAPALLIVVWRSPSLRGAKTSFSCLVHPLVRTPRTHSAPHHESWDVCPAHDAASRHLVTRTVCRRRDQVKAHPSASPALRRRVVPTRQQTSTPHAHVCAVDRGLPGSAFVCVGALKPLTAPTDSR